MEISLICATFGRDVELKRLLTSLAEQSFREFELIIVDQNEDDRVERAIASTGAALVIRRLTSSPPGLSRALNVGLGFARGDVIGFPDDDCRYPRELLQQLATLFDEHADWDGITVRTVDERGRPSIVRWDQRSGRLTKSNLGMRGCSTGIFYRQRVCKYVGRFDEAIGAESGANPAFDMDYLHRAVRSGFNMQYQPQLSIKHPQTLAKGEVDSAGMAKRYAYGYGEGSIARRYSVPLWYVCGILAFPLMRAVREAVCGRRHEAGKQWITFRSRLDGWVQSRI
jgi:glycosyltransferase involved in cell wall biosynthesis